MYFPARSFSRRDNLKELFGHTLYPIVLNCQNLISLSAIIKNMSVSVGIVGLPNVGKSTLFNALLSKQQAFVANYPFATIEPNVGVVPVPDLRLSKLAEVEKAEHRMDRLPPEIPATVEFVDIAGLVAGAHKGEGLGNKFLSHIREVDAIVFVLRAFDDGDIIRSGSVDPKSDLSVLTTELILADLSTLEKQAEPRGVKDVGLLRRWEAVVKLRGALNDGMRADEVSLTDEERLASRDLHLLTDKPSLFVINVGEEELDGMSELTEKYAGDLGVLKERVVVVSAKIEAELAGLTKEEAAEFMKDLGLDKSGLERLITSSFSLLGLMTFLTAGEKEVRAWTIKKGTAAPAAAGVIHSDFEKNFIRAEVVSFSDFIDCGGWAGARDKGKVRSEGRDYIMAEGDVVEFRVGV